MCKKLEAVREKKAFFLFSSANITPQHTHKKRSACVICLEVWVGRPDETLN